MFQNCRHGVLDEIYNKKISKYSPKKNRSFGPNKFRNYMTIISCIIDGQIRFLVLLYSEIWGISVVFSWLKLDK
jgi:hypothetical protein